MYATLLTRCPALDGAGMSQKGVVRGGRSRSPVPAPSGAGLWTRSRSFASGTQGVISIINKRMYFLYFLESQRKSDFIYVGVTRDLLKRLEEHNLGRNKSTKAMQPFELIYFEVHKTRSEARKREYYFKRDYGGVRLKKEIVKIVRRLKAEN